MSDTDPLPAEDNRSLRSAIDIRCQGRSNVQTSKRSTFNVQRSWTGCSRGLELIPAGISEGNRAMAYVSNVKYRYIDILILQYESIYSDASTALLVRPEPVIRKLER